MRRRRYYKDERELVRALERRTRQGGDAMAELLRLGPVFAGPRDRRRRYRA